MRLDRVGIEFVAGHHPALPVFVSRPGCVVQAADQRDLVHHSRHQREVLADVDPWHIRRDRTELAANFGRCLRLHVPCVQMPRFSHQEQRDTVADADL